MTNRPPRPALIACERGSTIVLAKPLAVVEGRPALLEGQNYVQVGTVRTGTEIVNGFHRHVWRSYNLDGQKVGEGATKPAAVRALLDSLNLTEAHLEDTIPDLLAGL